MGNTNWTSDKSVFTYKEGMEYTKFRNNMHTVNPLRWKDVNSGATVVFTNI